MGMFRIAHLAIQGYRSFKDDSMIRFPQGRGFWLVMGENRVHPRLGSNGAGKSSMFSALVWLFFDKTDRGLKGKEVQNWGENHLTSVCGEFFIDEKRYTLTRTYNPRSLSIQEELNEPRVITQEELEDLIGFNYTTFMSVVLMGQFNRFFFDLSATEKLDQFTQALGIKKWVTASEAARKKYAEFSAEFEKEDRVLLSLNTTLENLRLERDSLKLAVNKYEEEREAKIQSEGELLQAEACRLEDHQKRVEALLKNQLLVPHNNPYGDQITSLGNRKNDLSVELRSLEKAEAELKISIRSDQMKIKNHISVCPTCKRPLNDKAAETVLEEAKMRIEISQVDLAGIVKKIEDLMATISDVQAQIAVLIKKTDQRRLEIDEAKSALHREQQQVALITQSIATFKKTIDELEQSSNPHIGRLAAVREKIMITKEQAVAKQQIVDALKVKVDCAQYWVAKFKELRLWVVEQALLEFEIEVNNSLVELGLDGWKVTFDVERENSSGGVTKGFSVMITEPTNGVAVPWDAWCGGETQRLRIAGAIGFANLVRRRTGFTCNLEVWDEPTAHLSEEGIDDLLQFFANRASREEKQVWLIDHRSLSFGGFDGTVLVVKKEAGSFIIQRDPLKTERYNKRVKLES